MIHKIDQLNLVNPASEAEALISFFFRIPHRANRWHMITAPDLELKTQIRSKNRNPKILNEQVGLWDHALKKNNRKF